MNPRAGWSLAGCVSFSGPRLGGPTDAALGRPALAEIAIRRRGDGRREPTHRMCFTLAAVPRAKKGFGLEEHENYLDMMKYLPTLCSYLTKLQGTKFLPVSNGQPLWGTLIPNSNQLP